MINFSKTTHKNLLDLTEPVKTYAVAQVRQAMTLDEFAEHISSHNSKYAKADVNGVLTTALDCLIEQICNGNSVSLGDLGVFLPKLRSKGVCESVVDPDTGEKPVFSAADITNVTITWHKGKDLRNMINRKGISFAEVLTVEARNKQLKEKKEQLANGTYDPHGRLTATDNG